MPDGVRAKDDIFIKWDLQKVYTNNKNNQQ